MAAMHKMDISNSVISQERGLYLLNVLIMHEHGTWRELNAWLVLQSRDSWNHLDWGEGKWLLWKFNFYKESKNLIEGAMVHHFHSLCYNHLKWEDILVDWLITD